MKKRNRWILTLIFAGALGPAASLFAQPSEAELLKQAKIPKTEAEKIALAKVPEGKIQSAEIEREHHALVWSFDIVKTGNKGVTEVLVDAKTGQIVSINVESPADQAKEAAADKAHGQK